MSANKQLKAVARERAGKGAAREVRRQGMIPAVIYGGGEAPLAIAIDGKIGTMLIFAGGFLTTVFDIEVDGKKIQALPRDYQLDVVRDVPLHIDFLRLSAGQMINVEVPVHIVGQENAPWVKQGGTLQLIRHAIELSVPSNAIPDFIEISVAELQLGDVIHLEDITLPKGSKPILRLSATLLSIIAPSSGDEETAEEGAEGAAEAKE